jgi:peptide/nickel transport system permease protein
VAAYIIRRVIEAIPILIGIAVVSFLIVHLAPGSPADKYRGGRISPAAIAAVIKLYGLDQPLPNQLIAWLGTFPQLWRPDAWGYSFQNGRPVLETIFSRAPLTMLLMGSSLFLTALIGIPIGILGAVRQYGTADKLITILATIGYALPTFVLGVFLRNVFATQLKIFPLFGAHTLGRPETLDDLLWHMVLPVTTLTIVGVAGWSRYMRASMLEVLRQDYIRTARAKGLASRVVIFKHAMRNALIPVVTLFGLSIPVLLGGAAVTETIFSWPGLGFLGVQAVTTRDYPLVLAFVMIGGILVVLGNLVADVLYATVDPRIKY